MTELSIADEMRIFRLVGINNKKKLFEHLAEVLSTVSEDLSFENILDSLTSRERMGSTCIGDGVAIPHCKLPIDKPYGAIILLDEAVMCSTKDEPISVVFGFIIPEEHCQDHLPLLSEIASFCREGNWLQRIKSATSESQLRDILQSSDFNLAPYVNETSHS